MRPIIPKSDLRLISVLVTIAIGAFLALSNPQQNESGCLDQLYASTPPVLVNEHLNAKTRRFCYSEFVVLHSGVTRTPVWSAEHLTPERIDAANQLGRRRSSSFHAELRLPVSERAELDDYKRSGFDRGHMSPSGDMSTDIAQNESFSLANMVPQNPCHNEVMWEGIESAVRALALETEVFVVTGPAFLGDEIQTLDERVFVPTNIFKAVFLPSRNAAGAYWTPNDTSRTQEHISITRLTDLIGIDVFPRLDATVKNTAMTLPGGKPHHGCRTGISP